MTRGLLLPATSLALVLACGPASKPTEGEPPPRPAPAPMPAPVPMPVPMPVEPSVEEPVLPAAPVFAKGPFELREGKGPPRRPSQSFPKPRSPEDMQDHAWAFGWTADGSAFAHCTVISGAVCKLCTFTALDGASETLMSGEECPEDGVTLRSDKLLEARLADRGVAVRDAEWAHGGDLVVTAREVLGPRDEFGHSRSTLEVGTEWRDGSAGGHAYRENGCDEGSGDTSCFVDAHADAILPSPDGSSVAIVAHMWEGEHSDTFRLAIIPAGRLAAASYDKRGLDALARGEFEAAATAFLAAMHADTSAWKGPYNLACAHARAADPRAQAALRAAVERGGELVREKARKDGDLDSVRSQAWFTALIGSGE